jgi:predicted patatin/cPLA2 family phospholipase
MTDRLTGRVALVAEGGAMRGIFAAGVLDVFLEQRFWPFDLAIGVSVGASNVLSFLARQHGRTRRCFLDQMSRPEFIDPWRGVRGGHWMDLDWLWDAIEREDPLDRRAAAASGVEYALVATSVRTGKAHYLAPGADDMLEALKASCAIPVLYRKTVTLAGETFVDGGLSDPIPVREAYRRGAKTIVVLRSRAAHFVKNARIGNRVGAFALRSEPGLARACRTAASVYRDAVEFMQSPPADCRIIQVAPAMSLATGRTSRDRAALHRDYALGRALARGAIERFEQPIRPLDMTA